MKSPRQQFAEAIGRQTYSELGFLRPAAQAGKSRQTSSEKQQR
jgi:hypothetical protein